MQTETTQPADAEATPAAPLERSVVLVGLMGAGKTSIGRILAARLGLDFIDADAEIEEAAGCTIEEIFARHGEATFRSGERRVLARLLDGPVRIIATGGGAFMDADTRDRIAAGAISVWLKADLETLLRRVSRRGGRPLLKGGDPREVLRRLMAERDPVYALADITVETTDDPPDDVAERVIAALEAHLGRGPLAPPRAPVRGARPRRRNGRQAKRRTSTRAR